MYTKPTTTPSYNNKAIPPGTTSAPASRDLKPLDSKLHHISDKAIQVTPYILTVPSDRPYNLDKRLANDWRRGTPFDAEEEQLQYLSFLPDWDHGLISAVGGWANERGGMDTISHSQSGRSTTSTPSVGAKKTKISLSEYKKKTAGGRTSEASGAKSGEAPKQTNGASKPLEKPQTPSAESLSQKRSRETASGPGLPKHEPQDKDSPHTSKRIRTTPPQSSSSSQKEEIKEAPKLELPPFLSPTLPARIEKELKRLEGLKPLDNAGKGPDREQTAPSKHSDIPPKPKGSEGRTSSSKTNGVAKRLANPTPQKDEHHGSTSRDNGVSSQSSKTLQKPVEKPVEKPVDKPVAKKSKILKLKIPKSLRGRLSMLLRTPQPRQKPEASKGPRTEQYSPVVRSIELDTGKAHSKLLQGGTDASKVREKRPRQDDSTAGSAPQSKRPRQPSSLNLTPKPTTPIPGAFRSPVLSQHSAQKTKISTPTPDGRGIFPQERAGGVSTPQGAIQIGTPAAPDSAERGGKDGRPSSNLAREAQPELERLSRVNLDHHIFGRELKHASEAELNTGRTQNAPQIGKKGLALGVESILCFMMSYATQDEIDKLKGVRPQKGTWNTIFPYLRRVTLDTNGHSHLHGLCLQLEAVCTLARFKKEIKAASLGEPDAPPLTKLFDLQQQANSLFIEGATDLSVNDLQHAFPSSWRDKARAPMPKNGKFDSSVDGDFYLPMTSITTGLEAVRAGRSLLAEWCRIEGVSWTPRLGTKNKGKVAP